LFSFCFVQGCIPKASACSPFLLKLGEQHFVAVPPQPVPVSAFHSTPLPPARERSRDVPQATDFPVASRAA